MVIRFGIVFLLIIATATSVQCGESFIVNSLGDIEPVEPLENLVFEEVNRVREDNGLGTLIRDSRLDDAARQHSKEMGDEGYFEHDSPYPELKDHSLRIYHAGLTDSTTGENLSLFWTTNAKSDELTSKKIVEGWLGSPPHKKAMLTGKYDYTGVGIYITDDGEIYSTQLFADRTMLFDEIELVSGIEYARRVTATFVSDEDIIFLLDGDYVARFSSYEGTVFVDFLLKYESGVSVITLGREVEDHIIDIFYEKEVDPSTGFYLSYDIIDGSLIKEDIKVEKVTKYDLVAEGRLIEPKGELYLTDNDKYSPIEYEEDGLFSIEYPIYTDTGVHTLHFVTNELSNHRVFIDSERPIDEAFMKMQVLPRD